MRACARARADDTDVFARDVVWVVLSVSVAGLRLHLRLYSVGACVCMSLCLSVSILFPVALVTDLSVSDP